MKPTFFAIAAVGLTACTPPDLTSKGYESDLRASCESLVSAETGVRPDYVKAMSTQDVPTGSVTAVEVVGTKNPWLCHADPFGVITGVERSQESYAAFLENGA